MLYFPDVSEFQSIDWPRFTNDVVIVRAHNGTRTDHAFKVNQIGARAHTKLRGYYQYLVATGSPEAQATAFLAAVGPLQGDEFYVLDSEGQAAGMVPWSAGQQRAWSERWLTVVDAKESRLSLVYSNLSGFSAIADASHPKWVAHPGTKPALANQILWQYGYGSFAGVVPAQVDANEFVGAVEDLAKAVGLRSSVTSSPSANVPAAAPVLFPKDHMQSQSVTITFRSGRAWAGVPGGDGTKVVSVIVQDVAPSSIGAYTPVPAFVGLSTNPAEMAFGPGADGVTPDGDYGVTVWLTTT